MSGRVVWYRDNGERIVGYRKTDRRQTQRTPPHLMPPWRLSFVLPGDMCLPPGYKHSFADVTLTTIGRHTYVEISDRRRDVAIAQAHRLMARVAPYWRGSFWARLTRGKEPGPTLSGPLRRGDDKAVEIPIWGKGPAVIEAGVMRQLEMGL